MNLPSDKHITDAYALAKERYAMMGVDTEAALERLEPVSVSLHCWQGDDVRGLENPDGELTGGIAAIGNYPGRARNAVDLRQDLDLVYQLTPGTHRLALHGIYGESTGRRLERRSVGPEHFAGWVDWARQHKHGLDMNPSLFSHPMADSGFTLSSHDKGVRDFWIDHCIACRKIGEYFGRELGTPCVTNLWIPDGYKDVPVDRLGPRQFLLESLDAIFAEELDPRYNLDAVESKLFGLGSECYVTGSHEFYLGYAASRRVMLTLDSGHFHPTEVISDKLSAVLLFVDRVLLHLSRGVRWDSDHVVILSDELLAIMQEVVRGAFLDRVHIGLDYFDASINRVAAWTLGLRNALRALLLALLEPVEALRELEIEGDFTGRLALQEAIKALPFGAVWDYHCLRHAVPLDFAVMEKIRAYEAEVLSMRG